MKKYVSIRLPGNIASVLVDWRALLVGVALVALAFGLFIVSTGKGTVEITPLRVLKTLLGSGDQADALVIYKLRLPRILMAFLVGASLAIAGSILQGMIRNPLASPDIVGITGGASAATVMFMAVFQQASVHWIPLAALTGAAASTMLVYFLAWKRGVSAARLVLIGVGINAAMHALTTLLIVRSPFYLTSKALIWMTGSVYGSSWKNIYAMLPWFLVFVPLAVVLARVVNVQQLGDDLASGVGDRVERNRFLLLAVAVALSGSAVAFGGAIGFIGLVAPHTARKLVGPSYGALLPVSGLIGGTIVLAADLLARTAFLPLDLPVGLFTAMIGAPFFIYLLYRTRNG